MEAWQQIFSQLFTAYPILRVIWDALIIIAPLATLLAYSGIFFISSTAKILSITRKRAAFDKCARQTALSGIILGWVLLAGSRAWLYYTAPTRQPGTLESFMLEMSWLLLSMGVLLATIYYFLWRPLKNMPVLHTTLGMISATQNCISLVVILTTLRLGAAIALPKPETALKLPDLFPNTWNDPVWTAACYSIPLIFAMPGAIAACWLVVRRKKEDYGRDYYNTMLPWCCAWARNAWIALWLLLLASTGLQIWQQSQQAVFNQQDAILDASRILIWLVPPLLWTFVMRSHLPMRNAWLLFVALIVAGLFTLPYYLEITSINI